MSRIRKSLGNIFERERIVFWYDDTGEMRHEFEDLNLEGVTSLEVSNNEFALKYRMTIEDPHGKYLLYFPCAKPEDRDNWLLDMLLANVEFHADKAASILQDLGISLDFKSLAEEHAYFFNSSERSFKLKNILSKGEDAASFRKKMLAVICGVEPGLQEITLSLVCECTDGQEEKLKKIKSCNLESFLWNEMGTYFGYRSKTPSLLDFAFSLFITAYHSATGGQLPLTMESLVFLNRWKDSAICRDSFKKMSRRVAEDLDVEDDLRKRSLEVVSGLDIYEAIDRKIISSLLKDLLAGTIGPESIASIIDKRKNSTWYGDYQEYYSCLASSSEFLERLKGLDMTFNNPEDAFRKYTSLYYVMDQLYRQFVCSYRKTGPDSLLKDLYERVHNHYSNSFLLNLNDRWQQHINAMDEWKIENVPSQRSFYTRYVEKFPDQGKKIFVVISDALRYEAASELRDRLMKLDRYQAELESLLAVLPSYTQLGMAALLPHGNLSFGEQLPNVLADGRSTQGLANRNDILKDAVSGRGVAIRAEDFLELNAHTEGRELARDNDVIYIFHNGIDKTGDARDSEGRTFEAVEEEFEFLEKVIRKIANVNGNNILITSDHGFIYQDQPLDESDFAEYANPGDTSVINRRFVLGPNLIEHPALKKFSSRQLGLDGETEVLIPKSINRLRVHGAGSRYVHGGASLQEVVIPVLVIKKQRSSDTSKVDVDVINAGRITSRQPVFSFYQTEPVGEKMLPRELRIGLYREDGRLISEVHHAIFESTEGNGRVREKKLSFLLSKEADKLNNSDVLLKLEELAAPGVSQYRLYQEFRFKLNLPFEGDFEDL